jgi:6-pyruvoyltetrahydropterin/6-carboxytetrahydropterin synthase
MLYVTKAVEFSAAHRLFNPENTNERNQAVYDKCNNFYGHGHNYRLEVTVAGEPDPDTGYVIDLKRLKDIIVEKIVDKCDHKHLNFDVEFLDGIIPTMENLSVVFWKILENNLPAGKLHRIRIYETQNSFVDYYGEPVVVKTFNTNMEK